MSKAVISDHKAEHNTAMANYVVGFVLSVIFTLIAFTIVTQHWLTGGAALAAIGGLAILQFSVQTLCFLHLGGESKPRNKLMVFLFMLMVVAILVGGSIWIMTNLDYNMNQREILRYLDDTDSL
jgi:cytochrome o ubiquinol oxidase operon protein cyoD